MKKQYLLSFYLFVSAGFSFSNVMNLKPPSDSLSNYKAKPYVGIQVGTMGAGLQFAYPINDKFSIRAGGTFFPAFSKTISSKESTVEVTSDYTFQTGSAALIGDWSFSKNKPGVRLAFGAVYNMTKVIATRSYFEATYDIDLGKLDLEFTPKLPVSPYLGLVFGNLKKSKTVFFSLEVGALYHGKPQLVFTGDGRISGTANESNIAIIENNVKSLQFYPYANLQLNFKLKK